ncbi:4-hydroxythreonine-4-phosphate dehydrogenase PdxA [filamentous cyanobacterium LEGE 11480]|uniref:4-hydroxythreonine-4-phosphate dehydrogenase n=2 Tax=Romeriopsis TaxID=2992131 RepID=A0A928VTI9_9CYAN|nr:4-hydroxythreonine-4-phosphate dehydrogenase PdxA [Romeriopsis navalis LEGE 11480]
MGAVESKPRLIITAGDPAGIGLEVILKAFADRAWAQTWLSQAQVSLISSRTLLQQTLTQLDLGELDPTIELIDRFTVDAPIRVGLGDAASGAVSFDYLNTAIDLAMAGKFDGIVTAPIAKSAWQAAGHIYPGQTELLAEKSGADRFGMMFLGRSPQTGWVLRALLATVHIPLRAVPEQLTQQVMTRKLELLLDCLQQDFGLQTPHIAIAGLNPHSGELGQLGCEEVDWLQPWLEDARARYPQVRLEGLIPPDTMWVKPGRAWFYDQTITTADAYLALYHDQGLIPVKLMAFDRAVNTSIGLPFVRTSPDHGTAFDIAGQGIASPQSMQSAIEWAIYLCQQRCKTTKC